MNPIDNESKVSTNIDKIEIPHYDIIVIGAGPAGMATAYEASTHQLNVLLLDEQPECGGQIYRSISSLKKYRNKDLELLGKDYQHGLSLTEKIQQCNIDYQAGASVWNLNSADISVNYSQHGKSFLVRAKKIVIATGAMERPMPIPGWTMPGVMGAGAAQIVLKSSGMTPDGAIVLAGCGPLLLLCASQLVKAGANVVAVLETVNWRNYLQGSTGILQALLAPEYLIKGMRIKLDLKRQGIPIHTDVRKISAQGTEHIESVSFRSGKSEISLPANSLLLHQGVIPNTALTRQAKLKHSWNKQQQAWQADSDNWGRSSNPNILIAGDGAGIFGAKNAEFSGRLTGLELAYQLGALNQQQRDKSAQPYKFKRWRDRKVRKMLDRLYPPRQLNEITTNETLVCRCYEISKQQIVESIKQHNCTTADQVKSYLRCGMGPCQGRMCGATINGIIAQELNSPVEKIKYFNIRPPIKPITLNELSFLNIDKEVS